MDGSVGLSSKTTLPQFPKNIYIYTVISENAEQFSRIDLCDVNLDEGQEGLAV
jgi:hypothetical protein